jgi:cytoskeletal protein RodZ
VKRLSELGQLLRKARLEKGISLDDMQEITKIRKRYLEAIEEGNYKLLPGNFYVRAFIKSYSECVGLDPNEVLRLYHNVIPAKELDTQVEPNPRKRTAIKTGDQWSKRVTTLVFISFIIVIIGLMYYFIEKNKATGTNNLNTEEQGKRLTDKTLESPGPNNNSPTPAIETATPTPQATAVAPETQVKLASTVNGVDIYKISNSTKIELQFTSTEDCWYEIDQITGAGAQKVIIETGTQTKSKGIHTWSLDHSIFLVLGNAKVAQIKVNGVIIPAGDLANVKRFQFDIV